MPSIPLPPMLARGGRQRPFVAAPPVRARAHTVGLDLNPLHAVENVASSIGDAASSVASAVDSLPGIHDAVAWIKGQVEDFAKTAVGAVLLRALSSVSYVALAPYLGAQLAAVSFALPGVLKGDAFTTAWVEEFGWRVETTAEIVGPEVAQSMTAQLKPALDKLKELGTSLDPNLSVEDLAKKLGVREDVAALARDLYKNQKLVAVDVPDLPGAAADLLKKTSGGLVQRDGLHFDPISGKHIADLTKVIPASRLLAMIKAGDPAVNDYLRAIGSLSSLGEILSGGQNLSGAVFPPVFPPSPPPPPTFVQQFGGAAAWSTDARVRIGQLLNALQTSTLAPQSPALVADRLAAGAHYQKLLGLLEWAKDKSSDPFAYASGVLADPLLWSALPLAAEMPIPQQIATLQNLGAGLMFEPLAVRTNPAVVRWQTETSQWVARMLSMLNTNMGPIPPNLTAHTPVLPPNAVTPVTPAQAVNVAASVNRAKQLQDRASFVTFYLAFTTSRATAGLVRVGCGSCCAECAGKAVR